MNLFDSESLAAALVYLATGLLLLPFLYGRVIAHMRESLARSIFTRVVLLVCTAGAFLFGCWRGIDVYLILPVTVWMTALVIDLYRVVAQRKLRGSPPVEDTKPGHSLFRPFTTSSLAVRRYEMPVPEWSRGRMRIAHISDLHVHGTLNEEYFHGVTDRIRELAPDAVFITGDFISRARYARLLPEVLRGLSAPQGVYACLGNHDYWSDVDAVRTELGKTSVRLLDSNGVVIDGGGGKLLVSACEDPWGDEAWSAPARAEGVPMAVLSHTADNIYSLSRAGADIVFTGHYHAGQGAIPWYGSVVIPSKYGRIFDHGHFAVNGTHLFVTAGVGIAFPPFRVYCHPEVLVVDLVPGKL